MRSVVVTVAETPASSNGFKYKVVSGDGGVAWVTATVPANVGDRVELTYVSTASRGWYVMEKVLP